MSHVAPSELDAVLGSWMTGSAAARTAPAAWSEGTAPLDPAELELRLLALTGQALQVAVMPVCDRPLGFRPDLPEPSLPLVPDRLRPAFRRILDENKGAAGRTVQFLTLLAARGRMAHPLDWLPKGTEEALPSVYRPWADWVSGVAEAHREENLTETTWDEFTPSGRVAALRALRRSQPAEAVRLLQAKLAGEPAEIRHKLLEVLSEGMGEGDLPLLERLAADRSEKVTSLVRTYLARLGKWEADPGAVEALQGFFEKTKPFLRSAPLVRPLEVKKKERLARRADLMRTVPFSALASALGLAPSEFVEAWDLAHREDANTDLARMLADSGADDVLARFVVRLTETGTATPETVGALRERLTGELRRLLAEHGLTRGNAGFGDLVQWLSPDLGALPAARLLGSPAWKQLETLLRKAQEKDGHSHAAAIRAQLFDLGLLATAEAASDLLRELEGRGVGAYDSGLHVMQCNAALIPS